MNEVYLTNIDIINQELIYHYNFNQIEVYINWNKLVEIVENNLYEEIMRINQLIIDFRNIAFINEEMFNNCLNKYFLFHGYPFNIITD